jgi:hypothetical protein
VRIALAEHPELTRPEPRSLTRAAVHLSDGVLVIDVPVRG